MAMLCLAGAVIAQRTDTLVLYYKTDEYRLTRNAQQQLEHFLSKGWDKLIINGYTDAEDDDVYNQQLSQRRAAQVAAFFKNKQFPGRFITESFFGETAPVADNESDTGRALNRRTEVIGYYYPRVKPKTPAADPMKPVTRELDNGFIITYRPGTIDPWLAEQFANGNSSVFNLITNTSQMRQANLYTNTTRGEVLSSMLVFCSNFPGPCKLDSPVVMKIPVWFDTKCPLSKIKFFSAVAEQGKNAWQEESKEMYPEIINGRQYIHLRLDNFCQCINFDFKVDPDCFMTDSSLLYFTNVKPRNTTVELDGLNSVYLPRKINDSLYSILHEDKKKAAALVSFSLYNGKQKIRSYRNQPLSQLPFDTVMNRHLVTAGTQIIWFNKINVADAMLRVNKERYRTWPEKNKYAFVFLRRTQENIRLEFSYYKSKRNLITVRELPLAAIPLDPVTGYRVIDKNFLEQYQQQQKDKAIARR